MKGAVAGAVAGAVTGALNRRRAAGLLLAALASAVAGRWGPVAAADVAASPLPAADAEPIDFIALGDMPYGTDLLSGPAYRHLIDQINALNLPFAIHVGDFKAGTSPCTDDEFERQHRHFQRFAHALVYTPGDNDWLDCHRQGDDPLERLQALRRRFFAGPQSLGPHPLPLERQGDVMPAFSRYVENQRWLHRGVVLATFHTVGPDNGSRARQADVRAESLAREAANAAWIRDSFALARRLQARALVLATQAETLGRPQPLQPPQPGLPRVARVGDGFALSITQTLLPLAEAAPFPTLLIHGDNHSYVVDQPFRNARHELISQLWRLQVFGEPKLHAVRVRIEPAGSRQPFSFSPVWNLMSAVPQALQRAPA